jgi:hypothetical protein
MAGKKKAALDRAVEERTQQRLAARKEAAKRGAETKRRKREEAARHTDGGQAQGAPGQEVASQVAEEQTKATPPKVAQQKAATDRGPMVTVALRGESAARLRALAASQGLSLAKLVLRMMDSLEAETR